MNSKEWSGAVAAICFTAMITLILILRNIIMKQQNSFREEARQIVDDYYHLMNSTFGARYITAKQYAIDMLQRRIDTPDLPMDEKERWFFIKQEMMQL